MNIRDAVDDEATIDLLCSASQLSRVSQLAAIYRAPLHPTQCLARALLHTGPLSLSTPRNDFIYHTLYRHSRTYGINSRSEIYAFILGNTNHNPS